MELLLSKGDDVRAGCVDSKTALHYAAQMGHEAVAARLLADQPGDLVNTLDAAEWAPLHYAAEHGSLQLGLLFLEVEGLS